MRLRFFLLATTILLISASAGAGQALATSKLIYFLQTSSHGGWCGYASESRFKAQIQVVRALVVGAATYTEGHLSIVRMTQTDETGDWAVNDEYRFDKYGKLQGLKRTINVLPDNTSEEDLYEIRNGRATKERTTVRNLRTGEAGARPVRWFHAPPIITQLSEFPFLPLIGRDRVEIWSTGTKCIR